MFAKFTEPLQHLDCSKLLNKTIYNSVHSSTGEIPSVLLFGIQQKGSDVGSQTEYLENISNLNNSHLDNCRRASENFLQAEEKFIPLSKKKNKNHFQ